MKYVIFWLVPMFFSVTGCKKVRPSEYTSTAQELSGEEYGAFAAQKDKLVVVNFHATWCGPCRQLAPVLDAVAAEHGDLVRVGRIDVDQAREVAGGAGVRGLPDVRFYRDGKQVDGFIGLIPADQLRQKFQTHAQGLNAAAGGDEPVATPDEPMIQPMKKDWLPPGMERR